MAIDHTAQLPNPASDVRNHIVTPYNADAYELLLHEYNLTHVYPLLVFNLHHGFPIGDIPPISKNYIPKNHKSALDHLDVIRAYHCDKVALGRMSGPFTEDQVFDILGGHFASSPLGVVEKSGEPGKFRVVCDLSFKNDDGFSVNGHLDSDDFPTEWGTASQVAELVSSFSFLSHEVPCILHSFMETQDLLLLRHSIVLAPLAKHPSLRRGGGGVALLGVLYFLSLPFHFAHVLSSFSVTHADILSFHSH